VGAVERSRPQAAVPKRKADADALRPVAAAAVGSVRDTLKEQGLPASGNVTFVQARTAHEIAKPSDWLGARAATVRRDADHALLARGYEARTSL
jgi:hypothetical protein